MTIRPYRASDAAALQFMANQTGFPYPDLDSPMIESCLVVEDEKGEVIAALAAQRLVELYLFRNKALRPALFMRILEQMHEAMAKELRGRGYRAAEAFLPPGICERFGRRLERSFGWVKNWPSYGRTL